MAGRLRRLGIVATAAFVVGLSGCALLPAGDSTRLHEEAQADLARWADAVAAAGGGSSFVPVGELTGQVGDWEPDVGDNNKSALMAGMVEAAVSLPADPPPDGEVRWPDGTTTTVRLVSAPEALAGLKADAAGSACPDCTTLQLTGARLTTAPVQTSRGPATAPVWEFIVRGTAVKVTRVGGRCRGHGDASALGSRPPARRHLDRVGGRNRRGAATHGLLHRCAEAGGPGVRRRLHGRGGRVLHGGRGPRHGTPARSLRGLYRRRGHTNSRGRAGRAPRRAGRPRGEGRTAGPGPADSLNPRADGSRSVASDLGG